MSDPREIPGGAGGVEAGVGVGVDAREVGGGADIAAAEARECTGEAAPKRRFDPTVPVLIGVGAVLLIYTAVLAYWGIALVASGTLVGYLLAFGVLVFSGLGMWALVREVFFGLRANALLRRLEAEGGLLDDPELTARVDGAPTKPEATARLEHYAQLRDADPGNWRPLLRYGIVARAAGQYGESRKAVREAIMLQRKTDAVDATR